MVIKVSTALIFVTDKEQLNLVLSECNLRIAELKTVIITSTKSRFGRDAADYANNRVYKWRSNSVHHPSLALVCRLCTSFSKRFMTIYQRKLYSFEILCD